MGAGNRIFEGDVFSVMQFLSFCPHESCRES